MGVRFGLFVPQGWRMDLAEITDPVDKYEAMTGVAKAADAGPWDSVWVYDHFHTVPVPARETTFESWTTTAALARDTTRVNIGQMVTCSGYRNPALYAKMASTVDVMSHGRLYAGLGAGWYEHEWRAYGYGWPSLKDRMRGFAEAVEIVYRMWTEDDVVYAGEHHSVDRPINEPKGVRPPHPPLWIGGGGERVTLGLAARYADACNVGDGDPAVVAGKLAVLRRHCAAVGRDVDGITKSTTITAFPVAPGADPEAASSKARGSAGYADFAADHTIMTPDQLADAVEQVAAAGADYVLLSIPGLAYDDELLPMAEEVVGRFAA